MLILIQERELFFRNNEKKKRITEKEKNRIAVLKEELLKKLSKLNDSIEVLKNNPKIDSYFKALENYDELRDICQDLFGVMFAFLLETILKSLIKALSHKKEDSDALDESTISTKSAAIDDEIYEKSFSLLSFGYLSADKVNDVESDIHDLYHLSKKNYKKLNRWMQKYNEQVEVR